MKIIDADLLKIAINHERYHGGFKVKDVTQIIDEQLAVNAIPIPDGATNGDMIMAMFPQIKIREHNEFMFVVEGMAFNHETYSNLFFKDWWNAPYKKSEE